MGVWLSLPQPRSSTQLAGHHTAGDSNGAKAKLPGFPLSDRAYMQGVGVSEIYTWRMGEHTWNS